MTRQQKYPETATFHFYNANPRNRITTDCVARAICTALEISYEDCVLEQARIQIETGYDDAEKKGVEELMNRHHWYKNSQPRKIDGSKYTVREFCERIAKPGKRYVVSMANHYVAVVDQKAWDIWDCTDRRFTKCVGNYWSVD